MIQVAVEGDTDVAVVQRLLETVGLELGSVFGLRGKDWLDKRLKAFNHAARHARWFVLPDLNGDAACAPALLRGLLPRPAPEMHFRIAVRSSEAWLLADREKMAAFLGLGLGRIPTVPEQLLDPKLEIVNLARRSHSRAIREDLVPSPGTSAKVGPGYTGRMIEFTSRMWRPRIAAVASGSLGRCVAALERWVAR